MKKFLFFLAFLLASPALAVDNTQTCTGNSCAIKLIPKTSAGANTTVLTAAGTGAITAGNTGLLTAGSFHQFYGSLVDNAITSTGLGGFGSQGGLELSSNAFVDTAGGGRISAIATQSGFARLRVTSGSNSTDPVLEMRASTASQTAGSATTSATTTLLQDNSGLLTISGGLKIGGNTTSDSNLGTISSVTDSAYYEGSFSINFAAGTTALSTYTFKYIRVGKLVTIQWPVIAATTSGGVGASIDTTGGTGLPSALRPTDSPIGESIVVRISGSPSATIGRMFILSDGTISIRRTADSLTAFPASNAGNGMEAGTLTYALH